MAFSSSMEPPEILPESEQEFISKTNGHSNENTIVYPGTHDNQTVRGWFKTLPSWDYPMVTGKLGTTENLENAFLEYTWNLPSLITIFAMQDLLGLDDEARMNTPGTMGSPNWEWKLIDNSYPENIIFGYGKKEDC